MVQQLRLRLPMQGVRDPSLVLELRHPTYLEVKKPKHKDCLTWRAIPSPLSKLKRRLNTLESTHWAPRDPCRDFRGTWSPLLPLEARPDSPGESGMESRDLCLPLRGILGPGHTPRLGLFGSVVTRAETPAFPRNSRGRLGFPGPTQEEA